MTALVLLTGSTLAPVAQAAVTRTVSLSITPTTITLGQSATLRGAVSRSPVGTPVIIDIKQGTRWVKVKTVKTTTSAGAYKTAVKPGATGTKTYRARVVARTVNGRRLAAAKSPARQLVVKKATTVSRTLTLNTPAELLAYDEISLSGTITNTPAGLWVSIECQDPGSGFWDACGAATTTAGGTFTDPDFRIEQPGTVPVRAMAPQQSSAGATLAAATSTAKNVMVYGADSSGPTKLVSITPQRNFTEDRESLGSSISDDGRYVAFVSASRELVTGVDPAGHRNVFVRDLQSGTTRLVSTGLDGKPMKQLEPWDVVEAAISGNGRYVAYTTTSDGLVTGDTNAHQDVFVTDLIEGTTERASLTDGDQQISGEWWEDFLNLAISDDGRRVLFTAEIDGIVPEDTSGTYDAFVRDLDADSTSLVSRNGSGELLTNGGGGVADISGDGNYVVFSSDSSNIGPAGGSDRRGLFRRNLTTGAVDTIFFQTGDSVTGLVGDVDLSDDGATVVFNANVPALDGGAGAFFTPAHLWRSGQGNPVPVSWNKLGDLETVSVAVVSGDGSKVAFSTDKLHMVAGDPRTQPGPSDPDHPDETYVYDVAAKTNTLASVTSRGAWGGTGFNGGSSFPTGLSATGSRLSFDSDSAWLIDGFDSNFKDRDVFVRFLG